MHSRSYQDLDGNTYFLEAWDREERRLFRACKDFIKRKPDWDAYANYWLRRVDALYTARGLQRKEVVHTALYKMAQDLEMRLALSLGLVRVGDYRDDLAQLIEESFSSQRDFCKATGLSEDMISHVLAGRKHLGIDTLEAALERIGYRLRIAPRIPGAAVGAGEKKRRRKPA